MKTLIRLLIATSLALNIALAVLLFAGRTEPINAPTAAHPGTNDRAAPAAASDNTGWDRLNTGDLPALVRELRDNGFPPHIVRAIITGRLRDDFTARFRALDPQGESRPFWMNSIPDPQRMTAQRQLYKEQQTMLRELLGRDDVDSDINALYQRRRFDSVPPEKTDDVRRILAEFDDRRMDVFGGGGMVGPEQIRRLTALEQQQRDALASVLNPQELEQYLLRNSDTAQRVRSQLSAFNPNEEEFRSIYRIQSDFDSQFGVMMGPIGPEEQQRRSEAQMKMNEQIKAMLGPARGTEFERANDYNYRQSAQLINRLELPAETTAHIWGVKQEIEARAMAIRRDNSIPGADRTQQLAALADEATTTISPLLGGSRGFEAYRQYGGSWVNSLRGGVPMSSRPRTPAASDVAPGR